MPSLAFKRILQGLLEAIAYAQGNTTGCIVHHIEVPDPKPAPLNPSLPAKDIGDL
jgi:hypothetical protein